MAESPKKSAFCCLEKQIAQTGDKVGVVSQLATLW